MPVYMRGSEDNPQELVLSFLPPRGSQGLSSRLQGMAARPSSPGDLSHRPPFPEMQKHWALGPSRRSLHTLNCLPPTDEIGLWGVLSLLGPVSWGQSTNKDSVSWEPHKKSHNVEDFSGSTQ